MSEQGLDVKALCSVFEQVRSETVTQFVGPYVSDNASANGSVFNHDLDVVVLDGCALFGE